MKKSTFHSKYHFCENLAEILEGVFNFCSKWSPFSKMLVSNGDICFWKVSINGGVVFFWLKITFYTKALVFGQMSEFLTKVIKSCCADFEEKWQVFLSISILVKNVNFVLKKWSFGTNVEFFIKCALLLKLIIFSENMLIF